MCVTEVREVEIENGAANDLAIGRGSDPAKGDGIEAEIGAGVTENEAEATSAAGIEIEADREIGRRSRSRDRSRRYHRNEKHIPDQVCGVCPSIIKIFVDFFIFNLILFI